MSFIADFHIHSHFSLATSKELTPPFLDLWARIKGIGVIGTGDATHPGWLNELKQCLIPGNNGLLTLKKDQSISPSDFGFNISGEVPQFILTAEISNIYKRNSKVRKVHNLLLIPGFEEAEKLQQQLTIHRFNITSDGRPIIGLDSRDLLDMLLNISENIMLIPAHIWTPWFSVLGDKSGFDRISDCYGDLTNKIYAVEMGLSSDPPMNWLISQLDRFTLLSNSDAHSPEKLGRNANIFQCDPTYEFIIAALKGNGKFGGTISFFPQEGKYHYDGHRKCSICWNPLETLRHKGICPVCETRVTIGVMSRVAQLADRNDFFARPNRSPAYSLIPLKELLAEILDKGETTKPVIKKYQQLINQAGTEFNLLLHMSHEQIAGLCDPIITEAIMRMRNRNVIISEGYDGEYGKIKVFEKGTGAHPVAFSDLQKERPAQRPLISFDIKEYRKLKQEIPAEDI